MSDTRILVAMNVLDRKNYQIGLKDGIIESLEEVSSNPDGLLVCPGGMIDTQVNGFLGMDYSDPDFEPEYALKISEALIKAGTFQHFATIVTRPQSVIVPNIDKIVKACKTYPLVAKAITGIHVEGPFISPMDGPRGAHDKQYVKAASISEFDEWYQHSEGLLKYITVGAEVENVCDLIRHATSLGVVCSLGHTGATKEQIDKAVEAGATVSTHLGNGVFSKLDRFENPIWPQLRNDKLTSGIICDGDHVTPDLIWVFSRCKDSDHIILVSDLSQVAGLGVGRMKWGTIEVEIHEDGSVWVADSPFLAGAGSQLLRNTWNFAAFSKTDPIAAFKLSTINPIRKYDLDISRAGLSVGQKAEFIGFRDNGSGYTLENVFFDGKEM